MVVLQPTGTATTKSSSLLSLCPHALHDWKKIKEFGLDEGVG